jgi:uncharacterized protein involved in exopolysaccharide biosynthesis
MEENAVRAKNSGRGQPLGGLVLLMLLPLIGGVVGYFGAILLTYVQPKKYESVIVIQVHPSGVAIDSTGGTSGPVPLGAGVSPRFLPTEFEVITAEETLMRVVARLDLTSRWSLPPDRVIEVLRETIVATPIEGTDLIEIRVRQTVSGDAREIAEKVAQAYGERRRDLENARALAALDAEVRNQEDLVDEKRKVLDTLRAASLDAALEARDFVEAKRDLDRSVTLLESMRMQHAAQRIAQKIPRTGMTIHQVPRTAADPVFPNVGANLTMGVVAGAAVGLMFAILIGVLRTGVAPAPPVDDEWA